MMTYGFVPQNPGGHPSGNQRLRRTNDKFCEFKSKKSKCCQMLWKQIARDDEI